VRPPCSSSVPLLHCQRTCVHINAPERCSKSLSKQSLLSAASQGPFFAVHRCALRGCCRRGEAREVLAKLLGAPVKTYVTRCALLELKALGAEFAGASLGYARTC
jgi:hypothetical protein